jgi:hypothetical protein
MYGNETQLLGSQDKKIIETAQVRWGSILRDAMRNEIRSE